MGLWRQLGSSMYEVVRSHAKLTASFYIPAEVRLVGWAEAVGNRKVFTVWGADNANSGYNASLRCRLRV